MKLSEGKLGLPMSKTMLSIELGIGGTLHPAELNKQAHQRLTKADPPSGTTDQTQKRIPAVTEAVGELGFLGRLREFSEVVKVSGGVGWCRARCGIKIVLIVATNNNGAAGNGIDCLPLPKG